MPRHVLFRHPEREGMDFECFLATFKRITSKRVDFLDQGVRHGIAAARTALAMDATSAENLSERVAMRAQQVLLISPIYLNDLKMRGFVFPLDSSSPVMCSCDSAFY